MGLLKRFFSIGSKKSKKRPQIIHDVPLPDTPLPVQDEDHEAAVGRLLRSSSARYAEPQEVDHVVPPLPHHDLLTASSASTVSLDVASLARRGTYTVTVYGRKRHTSTEFPNANGDYNEDLPMTSRSAPVPHQANEDSRVLRLRSDPSVASLLEMYDEHGRLPTQAFSNSPPPSPKEERVQSRRNGSTLRELLGGPPTSLNSRNGSITGNEGDISWAERFLGETDSLTSSVSSVGMATPRTPDDQFLHSLVRNSFHNDISFSIVGDVSDDAVDNPAISSLEVELSLTSDSSRMLDDPTKDDMPEATLTHTIPATPRRASQIFSFLTEKRKSKVLPELPSAFSSPSDEGGSSQSHCHSPNSSFDSGAHHGAAIPATPIPNSKGRNRRSRSISTASISGPFPLSKRTSRSDMASQSDAHLPNNDQDWHLELKAENNDTSNHPVSHDNENQQSVRVLMTGPTKVILTAPTPSHAHRTPNRLPRGPRSLPKKNSHDGTKPMHPTLTKQSNSSERKAASVATDNFTHTHTQPGSKKRRPSGSEKSTPKPRFPLETVCTSKRDVTRSNSIGREKENQLGLAVKAEIPMTPMRTDKRSPGFRAAVHHGFFRPTVEVVPSPASSTEMSPIGRQMMADVRQQRLAAREADRERGARTRKSGSGKSVIRF